MRTGYHVNSNMPREEYLIPLKLTWTSSGALEPEAVLYPAPSIEKYAFADQPLSVFSGNFDLVAHFQVKGGERSTKKDRTPDGLDDSA